MQQDSTAWISSGQVICLDSDKILYYYFHKYQIQLHKLVLYNKFSLQPSKLHSVSSDKLKRLWLQLKPTSLQVTGFVQHNSTVQPVSGQSIVSGESAKLALTLVQLLKLAQVPNAGRLPL